MYSDTVSIITPVYLSERYISGAIESVIAQTYQDWELIVIDDGSPDLSPQIVKSYVSQDPRIKLIQLSENRGPAVARNLGIQSAQGRYIAFLDSDDLWYPNKLERQIDFMKEHNLSLICSTYTTIDEYGEFINTREVKATLCYQDMIKSNHIGNLTGMYDSAHLGKVYMEEMGHEDYTLWLKVMKRVGSTMTISEPLASYRISHRSISSHKIRALRWQWQIYRHYLELNTLQSTYYLSFYVYHALRKRRGTYLKLTIRAWTKLLQSVKLRW